MKKKHIDLQKEHTTATKAINQAVDHIRDLEKREERYKQREADC